jgi:hypothetical protein
MAQVIDKASDSATSAAGVMVLKAGGHRERFDPLKLRTSLSNSGATAEEVDAVMTHIEPELYNDISTEDIYRHAFAILNHHARPAARKYSLRRAVMTLGPSGFPFEDFVSELLTAKGYQTLTRQTVLGACVPHEMDVVAWNPEKLIMVEAKFHNEAGAKSDLKVALYIKARFDDIKENHFDYGGQKRQVTDSWLVTNTKFSSMAIRYGVCQDLTMIGWNYPVKGNLQDMIEETRLHPITCLTSLTQANKEVLMNGGAVLCSHIKNQPEILVELLGKKFNSQAVLDEINEL